jgi:UDP-glucose:(heptosyl)LPS alpha-1,3-glucosyltransferase
MRFAFFLFKYFPFGGQQINFLNIANTCRSRGHQVDVYTTAWDGDIPQDIRVNTLKVRGITNHRRRESLAKELRQIVATGRYDAIVGFIKIPDLDLYYAADTCFAAKAQEKNFLYRLSGRCRSYLRMEKEVFGRDSESEILLLSEQEKKVFKTFYDTPDHRFHLLPPGISKDWLAPGNTTQIGSELRRELSIGPDLNMVLFVGSGYRTKGLNRAIRAISSLPIKLRNKTVLFVVGQDSPLLYRWLAWRLGVSKQVSFLQGRDDILRFFAAADILLHPAYRENTGTVLIEAMAAGLPVLTTAVCGYTYHIERAAAGEVVPAPFKQKNLNQLLLRMLTSDKKEQWQRNARAYIARTDVSSRAEKAADVIEKVAVRKKRRAQ